MTQEALKLALEWFKCYADKSISRNNTEALADEVVEAIEKALAQTQEPFAYVNVEKRRLEFASPYVKWDTPTTIKLDKIPLYTTPQQRTEQEPFCLHWEDRWGCNHYADPKEPHPVNAKPLYTTPPQRTWVGLTDEEICTFSMWLDDKSDVTVFTAIETKLKEKNT